MTFRVIEVGTCEDGHRHRWDWLPDTNNHFYCFKCGLSYGIVEKGRARL